MVLLYLVPYSKCAFLYCFNVRLRLVQQLVRVSPNALLSACSLRKSLDVAFLQHCFPYLLITHEVNTLSANRC